MSPRCHLGNSRAQAAALPQRPPKPRSWVARLVCASGRGRGEAFPRLAAHTGRVTCLAGSHLLLAHGPPIPTPEPQSLLPALAHTSATVSGTPKAGLSLSGPSLCRREGRLRPLPQPSQPQRPLPLSRGQQQPAGQRRGGWREDSRQPVQQKKEKHSMLPDTQAAKAWTRLPPRLYFSF